MGRPPIHPGEILADELAKMDIEPDELARQLKIDPPRLVAIIAGRQGITADTALRLGHWFETSADFWLNLQKAYELRVAEQAAGEEIATLPVRSPLKPQPAQPSLI